jgi:hypothetical protein
VLGKIAKYFHHLFEPHCLDCASEARCKTCDSYKELLADERRRTNDLLDRLIEPPLMNPLSHIADAPVEIKNRKKPWNVLRRELEEKDRLTALNRTIDEEILTKKQSTEELESELGIK